ncbi:hypothetical protein D3C84_1212530 [compost metagenome]
MAQLLRQGAVETFAFMPGKGVEQVFLRREIAIEGTARNTRHLAHIQDRNAIRTRHQHDFFSGFKNIGNGLFRTAIRLDLGACH